MARQRAEVYLNEKLVGYDIVGNTPFRADITDAVKWDGTPNVLAVRPRSIGIVDCGDKFIINFMEAPMKPANEAMESWATALKARRHTNVAVVAMANKHQDLQLDQWGKLEETSRRALADQVLERLEKPEKHWKFNPGDLKERALWKEYMKAYEEVLEKTSTPWAPWYVIPANKKWYRDLVISALLVETLQKLDIHLPATFSDQEVAEYRRQLSQEDPPG